jgi:hypothetical protein
MDFSKLDNRFIRHVNVPSKGTIDADIRHPLP